VLRLARRRGDLGRDRLRPRADRRRAPRPGRGVRLCPTDTSRKIDLALARPPVVLAMRPPAASSRAAAAPRRTSASASPSITTCRAGRAGSAELGLFSQCAGYKKTGTVAAFEPAGGGWAEYVKVLPWIVRGGGVVRGPRGPARASRDPDGAAEHLPEVHRRDPVPSGRPRHHGDGAVGLMLAALARRRGWSVLAVDLLDDRRATALGVRRDRRLRPRRRARRRAQGRGASPRPAAAITATDAEKAVARRARGGALRRRRRPLRPHPAPPSAHDRRGADRVAEKRLLGSYSSSIELNGEVTGMPGRPRDAVERARDPRVSPRGDRPRARARAPARETDPSRSP